MPDKYETARPVNKVSDFNSQVDIIVPFHGQYERVMKLMTSIFKLTRSNYYKLILVDDCSANDSFSQSVQFNAQKNADRNRAMNVVQVVRTEQQLGFGGALKAGYEAGESPYICCLHSDCELDDPQWLRNLGESLLALKSENVRVISAMTNNATGGSPLQEGDREQREKTDVVLPDGDFLTLYCFMCHRELFPRIGGFIRQYPYFGYEDEEFAHRLRHYGFKQAVSRRSWVEHEGAATTKPFTMANADLISKVDESNRNRCIQDMKALRQTRS